VIDVSKATVKGDGLQRAAVNCSTTFRVSTKASGEANLDVTVTGDYLLNSLVRGFLQLNDSLWYVFPVNGWAVIYSVGPD